MASLFNKILQYLPPFITNTGKKLDGLVSIPTGIILATVTMTGVDTKFTEQLNVDDEIIFWGIDAVNLKLEAKVLSITSDLLASIQIYSASTSETSLNISLIGNTISQSIFIAIDNQLTNIVDNIRLNYRFSEVAQQQISKEWGLYIGKWETTAQLSDFLTNVFETHQRRGTLGINMIGATETLALDDVGFGILGECDRITKNPTIAGVGGTEIVQDSGLYWTLAGDTEYVVDAITGEPSIDTTSVANLLWRYPDFTIPTAAHILGEYSPGLLAVCWLSVDGMYVIILDNKNETYYNNREINKIIEKIVPMDIPYITQFI